ncbi:MAG: NADH-quinone oxidoreductase subunit H [Candidatus Wallbacteria bacterium]|nr:NADH-quinone oxidoreductase subunit H [Candidatus Wallbacteria bacterium]
MKILIPVFNILLIIFFPLLYAGVINCEKAWWCGRRGPSIWQPFYDFVRLLRKGAVISTATSPIFAIAPSITFSTMLIAALVVPLANNNSLIGFPGDFIFFAYLMGLGKFFSLLAAMDTGSSFEGMGASREITFSTFVEPAFFIVLASCAILTGQTAFNQVFSLIFLSPGIKVLSLLLCSAALFVMLLTEGCRTPVDDPNTHLELTMIHEVMVLDNSGPDLALLTYAHYLKMVLISAMIVNIFMPVLDNSLLSACLFSAGLILTALAVAVTELSVARLRMSHVPQFVYFMNSLGYILLFSIILIAFSGR